MAEVFVEWSYTEVLAVIIDVLIIGLPLIVFFRYGSLMSTYELMK